MYQSEGTVDKLGEAARRRGTGEDDCGCAQCEAAASAYWHRAGHHADETDPYCPLCNPTYAAYLRRLWQRGGRHHD